jgi:transposase
MRPKGDAIELEVRRKVAARMFAKGMKLQDVADACGVTVAAVKVWKRAWKKGGVEALAAKPHPGRQPRMTPSDKQKLVKLLLAGARKAGFSSDWWSCPRVAQLIEQEFGVKYHPDHVWKILHGLGWSCQKPERFARERDEAAIEQWRKTEWQRIKKGGVAEKLAWFLSMKAASCSSR